MRLDNLGKWSLLGLIYEFIACDHLLKYDERVDYGDWPDPVALRSADELIS